MLCVSAEFLGFGRERGESIRARTFAEVSTLHPEDMEPVLKIHIRLRRRLERYAKLKMEMEQGLALVQDGGPGEGDLNVETLLGLKQGIEETWENEGKELRDAFDKVDKDASGTISDESNVKRTRQHNLPLALGLICLLCVP